MQLGLQGGTDFGSNMPAYESFTLGGPLHLSGYRLNEFAGREFWFARAMYYNKIFPLPDILGSGVYVGASAEAGRMSNRFDGLPSPGQLWSGSAFLGADTFVGPMFIGLGAGARRALEPVPAARRAVSAERPRSRDATRARMRACSCARPGSRRVRCDSAGDQPPGGR